MKLKHLESALTDLEVFQKPNVELEQYPTGAHLASQMLYNAHGHGDIEDKVVVDLGCGCGVLAIAATLMIGVDIDESALEVALENCDGFEDLYVDMVQSSVADVGRLRLQADTVVMNPPFGTRRKGGDVAQVPMNPLRKLLVPSGPGNCLTLLGACGADAAGAQGADMEFLAAGFAIAKKAVYSLNKSSTRTFIKKYAEKELGAVSAKVVAEMRYALPASYRFHKKDSKDIEVDMWRFEVPGGAPSSDEDEA